MFPNMTFCIMSTDPDFVSDFTQLLHSCSAEVYIATDFEEFRRLQEEGVAAEMLVVDPIFKCS